MSTISDVCRNYSQESDGGKEGGKNMREEDQDVAASRQEAQEIGATDEELLRVVEEIEQQLSFIQRERRRVIEDDERRGSLTAPQRQAMIILTQANSSGGMTLKELSQRMGLA